MDGVGGGRRGGEEVNPLFGQDPELGCGSVMNRLGGWKSDAQVE